MNIHAIFARLSPHFRERRMRWFKATVNPEPSETILDVGGCSAFWLGSNLKNPLTILNVSFVGEPAQRPANFEFVLGDGCKLPFADASFDIVFSNSAIEHVGTWERQQAFAREALRVGRRVWIQTPARGFFIEPHLLAPFIHWLPASVQRRLIRWTTLWGWIERPSAVKVDAFLAEVRLLNRTEMQELFPSCAILHERVSGLTKSFVAVRLAAKGV